MKDPLIGTDRTSYEREETSQLLRETSKSPVSHQPMQMHCLTPDFTIRRILSALVDNKITEDLVDHISKVSSGTNEKIPTSNIPVFVNTTSIKSVPPASISEEAEK